MKIHYSLHEVDPSLRQQSIVTVGNFDGLHLGHQVLIDSLVKEATKLQLNPVVITFVNHPASIIRPEKCPLKITTNEYRIHLFKKMGIKELFILEFSQELAGQTSLHFLENLSKCITINKIVMGHDAAFGKDREGTFLHLQKLGMKLGFTTEEIPPVKLGS